MHGGVQHSIDQPYLGNTSVSFKNDGDYLSIDPSEDFRGMYDSEYTWEFWFLTTDISSGTGDGYGSLFSLCSDDVSVSYGCGFDSLGNLFFKYWNPDGLDTQTIQSTTTIQVDTWYNVDLVKDC